VGAEVFQAGFVVVLFAGEVHGAGVAAGARQRIAEGQAGAGFVGGVGDVAASAFGAEPVGVGEVGRGLHVGRQVTASVNLQLTRAKA